MYEFFLSHLLIFALTVTSYVSIFLLPLCHQFDSHHQGFNHRDTTIGHVNMYLVKAN